MGHVPGGIASTDGQAEELRRAMGSRCSQVQMQKMIAQFEERHDAALDECFQ